MKAQQSSTIIGHCDSILVHVSFLSVDCSGHTLNCVMLQGTYFAVKDTVDICRLLSMKKWNTALITKASNYACTYFIEWGILEILC